MSDKNESFSERIARLTKTLKIRDRELAAILQVSATQARRIKSGYTASIKFETGLSLADRLGVTPYYLAGRPEPVSREPPPREPGRAIVSGTVSPISLPRPVASDDKNGDDDDHRGGGAPLSVAQRAEVLGLIASVTASLDEPGTRVTLPDHMEVLRKLVGLNDRLQRALARIDVLEAELRQSDNRRRPPKTTDG